jgi:hypothetical protein
MASLAATLGTFLGHTVGYALKICGKDLVDLAVYAWQKATTSTTEDSKRDQSLEDNLRSQLPPKP